jgi:hypothetical protein
MEEFEVAIPAIIRWSIAAADEEEAEMKMEHLVDLLGASFPTPGEVQGRVFPNEVIDGEIDMRIRRVATPFSQR